MDYLERLFSLEGKVAVVTSASRGVGKGIAEALLNAGATVVLVGVNPTRLEQATDSFRQQGLQASMHRCDVGDKAQVSLLIEYVKQQRGRIDILVNNAGVTYGHKLFEYPDDAWDQTLRVNLESCPTTDEPEGKAVIPM